MFKRLFLFATACCVLIVGLQLAWVASAVLRMKTDPEVNRGVVLRDAMRSISNSAFWEHNADVRWHQEGAHEDADKRVWAYVNRHSVNPGEAFSIALAPKHGVAKGHVEIFRVGAQRQLMFSSKAMQIDAPKELPSTTASLGPNWQTQLNVTAGDAWTSGFYGVNFVHNDGHIDEDVAFLTVTNPAKDGDIVLKFSTNTYQAYTQFGGHNMYRSDYGTMLGGHMVSFDRPTRADFYLWEYWYVVWLEQVAAAKGLKIDFISDFDLHAEPDYAEYPQIFVSLGHDEYWSKEMFDSMYDRIHKHGKNTLFLGANIAYWQVRYADVNANAGDEFMGRQMICYKSLNDPIAQRVENPEMHVTARFRDGARRPETMLMGVGYDGWFEQLSTGLNEYDPHSPQYNPYERDWFARDNKTRYPEIFAAVDDHPLFAGTGWKKGQSVGKIFGYEWDAIDPVIHVNGEQRLWKEGVSQIPELPSEKLTVLFTGEDKDTYGRPSKAESVYFESDAGGKVFSASHVRWAWGVSKPDFVTPELQRFNQNLLEEMLK